MMGNMVSDILDPRRWGVPSEAIESLGDRLQGFWSRFRDCFKTKTRDSSAHAWTYLRGLLELDTDRNYANVARSVNDPDDDGQKVQHFMSDSPWQAQKPIRRVQDEIETTPELCTGSVLLLDESPDEKAGPESAGAGRQHNGRLGKIEMSQVGVFLAIYNGRVWTWIDGELYLPAHWFTPEMAEMRQKVGVPVDREFATKIELGWQMVQRVEANGVPFEAVARDDLYGRSAPFRHRMAQAGIIYVADVPESTQVYLQRPDPETSGEPSASQNEGENHPVEVRHITTLSDTHFTDTFVRNTERGELCDPFAMRRVWTVHAGIVTEEWLVIRHENHQRYSYASCNSAADTSYDYLAWLKCVRHFVERSNQESKSEMGWDDFQARKYRAWEHNLAMTVLASWFIAQTKIEWSLAYRPDPDLTQELNVNVLPALSVANVRVLLQAVMPLPHLSPMRAQRLVVKHLFRRARSTRSRLQRRRRNRALT
jgi:SRSO17 transposase